MRFYKYLNEKLNNYVVVYSGRFQPWHIGHFETFENANRKFGKNNVYIATSDKVELPKSPFNFNEKQRIITTLFPVPKDRVVRVKNPYAPAEILNNYGEDTVFISVVGKKDADRLMRGKYFEEYQDGMELKGYKEKGYCWIAPENVVTYNGKKVSGTLVRDTFRNASEADKKELFMALYPKWNNDIFDLVINKLGDS